MDPVYYSAIGTIQSSHEDEEGGASSTVPLPSSLPAATHQSPELKRQISLTTELNALIEKITDPVVKTRLEITRAELPDFQFFYKEFSKAKKNEVIETLALLDIEQLEVLQEQFLPTSNAFEHILIAKILSAMRNGQIDMDDGRWRMQLSMLKNFDLIIEQAYSAENKEILWDIVLTLVARSSLDQAKELLGRLDQQGDNEICYLKGVLALTYLHEAEHTSACNIVRTTPGEVPQGYILSMVMPVIMNHFFVHRTWEDFQVLVNDEFPQDYYTADEINSVKTIFDNIKTNLNKYKQDNTLPANTMELQILLANLVFEDQFHKVDELLKSLDPEEQTQVRFALASVCLLTSCYEGFEIIAAGLSSDLKDVAVLSALYRDNQQSRFHIQPMSENQRILASYIENNERRKLVMIELFSWYLRNRDFDVAMEIAEEIGDLFAPILTGDESAFKKRLFNFSDPAMEILVQQLRGEKIQFNQMINYFRVNAENLFANSQE